MKQAQSVVLKYTEIGFSWEEFASFLDNINTPLKATDKLDLTWKVDDKGNREVVFYVEREKVTVAVIPQRGEDINQFWQELQDAPIVRAIRDTKRVLALGLTEVYKRQITDLWER